MDIFKDKIFIVSALGVVVLGLFLTRKKNTEQTFSLQGYDTEARNDTLYIPTTETHIEYVGGDKTTSTEDNRTNTSVGDNSTVQLPSPPKAPIVSKPPAPKYKQITRQSSIFASPVGTNPISSITPQRVEVLQEGTDGWLKIKSWKGDVWVKDGLLVSETKTKTHTIKKGDTLWSLSGGNKSKVQQIALLNGIKDINKIQSGVTIKIPV
jgi:nucleoid-associated protein YgaU